MKKYLSIHSVITDELKIMTIAENEKNKRNVFQLMKSVSPISPRLLKINQIQITPQQYNIYALRSF
jgi:hypothetical protein